MSEEKNGCWNCKFALWAIGGQEYVAELGEVAWRIDDYCYHNPKVILDEDGVYRFCLPKVNRTDICEDFKLRRKGTDRSLLRWLEKNKTFFIKGCLKEGQLELKEND